MKLEAIETPGEAEEIRKVIRALEARQEEFEEAT